MNTQHTQDIHKMEKYIAQESLLKKGFTIEQVGLAFDFIEEHKSTYYPLAKIFGLEDVLLDVMKIAKIVPYADGEF